MSLTLLLDLKGGKVGVVRWFREHRGQSSYPCGPLEELTLDDFRKRGVELVREHFEDFMRRSVDRQARVPVLEGEEGKAYLKKKLPILITRSLQTGVYTISPIRFRKYSLGEFDELGAEFGRKLPAEFPLTQFWEAFDAVIGEMA
jgi:hypothetical protein